MLAEIIPFLMFAYLLAVLMLGYPVAISLGGGALLFGILGYYTGTFDASFLSAIPERMYGIMRNEPLIAVPLFILMGVLLQLGKISEDLLISFSRLFGRMRGGLAVTVCVVGAVLAASTGIVGATVVTMGLISLPVMMRYKYNHRIATGVITASGTLGQIIPPSIVLVLLGSVISNANQKAQLSLGNFSPTTVSVGDLFFGALFPGLLLVGMYVLFIIGYGFVRPQDVPSVDDQSILLDASGKVNNRSVITDVVISVIPPVLLIICVLGSILYGIATPTEASGLGVVGAIILCAIKGTLNKAMLNLASQRSMRVTCMVFLILLGANIFSLVFRGIGGDEIISEFLLGLPGGQFTVFLIVMLLIFFLGFFLDFIEIIFVIVPIVAPILIQLGMDPLWLGVMIAVNLQTAFLTPPFGFSLFYLRGVAPPEVKTKDIYWGIIPFIMMQILLLVIIYHNPEIVTWLPEQVYATNK